MDRWQDDLDRLEKEDPEAAEAAAALDAVYGHINARLPSSLIADIYDLERPYEHVLSPDEVEE